MKKKLTRLTLWSAVAGIALSTLTLPHRASAQDDEQDDPPTRVARLGYLEGSVSFEPAGETDWVGAVSNRPMTTGDKLWADKDSRAELQLGSVVIRVGENTGISFLNLDDHTIQLQLSSGQVDVRVRRIAGGDDVEIDTPNLAFTAMQPGRYRIAASEDGSNTLLGIRDGGEGEATGNGQTYTIHSEQSAYFSGTDSLNADVEPIGEPDQFDAWIEARDHRWAESRSAQYLSRDVVGFDDLDDNGDWRDESDYGHVWFPRVEVGWAPYREGHWDWIDPWGYTWVDDSPWGYAPFHYGRWVNIGGRWGWIAGPPAVEPVYAPALVVFIGAGGPGFGGNIGWFPLGPREVYVPSYAVSRTYMTQINISNTTVNTTVVTNVYNTTVINRTTNITNVTYMNRSVQGAVTAVPQRAFASAQPVAKAVVQVSPQQIAAAPVSAHVAVNPTPAAVLGARAATAGHVTAPPAAVMNRQVIAKRTPPPPPVSFAKQQQAMAAHPGQPLPKRELASLRPATPVQPAVRVAPAGKPATPTVGHPANQPAGNQPAANRPAANLPAANQPAANRPMQPAPANQPAAARPGQPAAAPANRPGNQPAASERPTPAQPNRPPEVQPNNRPETNRPTEAPVHSAPPPNNRPPAAQPAPANRQPAAQPNNRPEANRPTEAPVHSAPPPANRPPAAQPAPNRPTQAQPNDRPQANRPPAKPTEPAAKPAPKPQPKTPEEKKREEEQQK